MSQPPEPGESEGPEGSPFPRYQPPPPPPQPQYPTYSPYTGPPSPYGVPYGTPPGYLPPTEHPQSTAILALGIVGLVLSVSCCGGFLTGIPAWVMGHKALKNPGGHRTGLVRAGYMCGMIATVLSIVALVVVVLLAAMGELD